ncbi:hypothetical protein MNBD_ALPHA12-413 [hydrothermal vent metagenome]|uniref:FAD/NAD(P)-binding domain-containing protein n=1 Tax=hydrothermal vent metagenome TaxID=652676 RepID=A0A3B0UJ22_9ZZZZ
MTREHNFRLPFKPDCLFSGQLIKREMAISFRLNGRKIKAFEGDTILSALMAAGIDSAGQLDGEPIALDHGLCLEVFPAGKAQSALMALPIERTKAVDGMELVTPAKGMISSIRRKYPLAGFAAALLGKSINGLDYDLGGRMVISAAWSTLEAGEKQRVDLVVVGAGVAGMSAALMAAKKGLRVALIERQAVLGGDAQFFGSMEGEKQSQEFVDELKAQIDQMGAVLVFTNAQALTLSKDKVRVHQATQENGMAATRLIDFATTMSIIATGTLERLPIFYGNRLPGVTGSRAAFYLAAHYGVWRGQSAAFCTVSSAATQVALGAADLGIKITKLADGRTNPKSRFFEFAKAYGISLATGTQIVGAQLNANHKLGMQLGLNQDGSISKTQMIEADRLVVCGGWQPDLTLWIMAGGRMKWNSASQQLAGAGELKNIALAGSAAGVTRMSQCARSGEAAVLDLAGQSHDLDIMGLDIMGNEQFLRHESPDGALPISRPGPDTANCYLDSGFSFAMAKEKEKKGKSGFSNRLAAYRKGKLAGFEAPEKALSINDVAAKIALKEIDPELAELIAQERCCLATMLAIKPRAKDRQNIFDIFAEQKNSCAVPAYLYARFGPQAKIVELTSGKIDNFEIGSLIYPSMDQARSGKAIGVIFAVQNENSGQGTALVDLLQLPDQGQAIVSNNTHAIKVNIRQPRSKTAGAITGAL